MHSGRVVGVRVWVGGLRLGVGLRGRSGLLGHHVSVEAQPGHKVWGEAVDHILGVLRVRVRKFGQYA